MRSASTERVAERLGIAADHVLPAYEDPAELDAQGRRSCPTTSIRPIRKLDDPTSAPASCASFERGSRQPVGYVLPVQRWNAQARRRLDQRAVEAAPRAAVPGARRFADRLPPAARLAAACARRTTIRISCRPTRSPSAAHCADPAATAQLRRRRAAHGRDRRRVRRHAGRADASRATPDAGAHRAVRRAARRHACASSCRRSSGSRTISNCSRRSRRPPRELGTAACISKAIRRRTIRASMSSRSRPIPA